MEYILGKKIVKKLSKHISEWCQRPRIQSYWIKKQRFMMEELTHIDLTIAEAALQSVTAENRRWVTKHSYGYCGVNKWQKRGKKRESAECPRCPHPVEDTQHVWLCQGKESINRWTIAMASLSTELIRLRTEPLLASIIISRLTSWQTNTTQSIFPILPDAYTRTLQHQDDQGWENFFIGLPAKGWPELQHAHYKRLGLKHSGKRWLMVFIRKLWTIAWDIWNYRNDVVHDKTEGIEALEINAAITLEYQQEQTSPAVKRYFEITLQTRLQASFDHKAAWLHNVQIARARQQRRNLSTSQMRITMANWLATAHQHAD
jgi:hypothetical protein